MEALKSGLYFDKTVVISLPRRKDRLAHFFRGWQQRLQIDGSDEALFGEPQPLSGVDGESLGKPSWFRGTPGVWGCRWSHLRAIEEAMNSGVERLLVFEDDACIEDGRKDLWSRMERFLKAVPDGDRDFGWDFMQLGYTVRSELAERKGEFLDAGWVVDTHAIAYRGKSFATIYQALVSLRSEPRNAWLWPIDQHLAHLHRKGILRRYLPRRSLIHQHKGFLSDIQK